jgi:hypothetical protein
MFRKIQKDLITYPWVLRCFQDVKTRWDSTNRMLMRVKKLRKAVDKFTVEQCPHLALSDKEWKQIDYLISILRPFAVFTQLIGSTRSPTIHTVFDIYNILLDHIERCKAKLERKREPWKIAILHGIRAAEIKFRYYYAKADETDVGILYGLGILLNPAGKETTWQTSHWVNDPHWRAGYWVQFDALYDREYRNRTPAKRRLVLPKELQKKKAVSLDDVMARIASNSIEQQDTDMTDAEGELQDYRQYGMWVFLVVFLVVICTANSLIRCSEWDKRAS